MAKFKLGDNVVLGNGSLYSTDVTSFAYDKTGLNFNKEQKFNNGTEGIVINVFFRVYKACFKVNQKEETDSKGNRTIVNMPNIVEIIGNYVEVEFSDNRISIFDETDLKIKKTIITLF